MKARSSHRAGSTAPVRGAAIVVVLTLTSSAALAQDPPAPADSAAARDSTERADGQTLPLEPADTIAFTTSEATWLSLDITPDGEAIVFELLGDLYTLPFAGGKAARITEGLGYDSQPRVSPDGEWIAFISDRDGADNLWVARIDGSEPRKLSRESQAAMISPTWTPDGQYVIVTRRARGTELRMYHIHGGSGLTLQGPEGEDEDPEGMGAALSPDGRYLYFSRRAGGGSFPNWQIVRRDMRSGALDVLTQAEWGALRPLVSPDGRWLVYGTRHETETGLRVRDLETGADRWLIWPIQRDEQEASGASRDLLPNYAFTPDGREVVTTFDGRIQAVDLATGTARTIPFEAEVRLPVGPELDVSHRVDDGPVRARLVQSPRLSPDGRRAAFSVLTGVYTMELDGGEPRRITGDDVWAFHPAWSPDGEWIAYVTWSTEGGHIWKTRADGGGEPVRLTSHPAFYADLAFSPDGERIVALRGNAFLRNRTFSEFGGLRIPLDVVWLPADGGDARLVAPGRGVRYPHFAGDPDRVYVTTNDGLESMRFDGTDRRTHVKVTGRPNPRSPQPPAAQAILLRPDGRWALASSQNQLYVLAVPPAGGAPPSVGVSGGAVPVEKITDIGADYFGWADGGETIYWAIGSTLFRRSFESIEWGEREGGRERGGTAEADSAGVAADSADIAAGPVVGGDSAAVADFAAIAGKATPETKTPLDYADDVQRTDIILEFPRAKPSGTVVLRGATVITMRDGGRGPGGARAGVAAGDGASAGAQPTEAADGTRTAGTGAAGIIEDADVVVTDDRIAAVGPRGRVTVPDGARVIDVAGTYIVPGFIDTHAHWEFRTHDVLEPHNWSLLANLAYGVTAGLDVQTSTNDYFAYQDLVDVGLAIGQRAFMTGPGVFSSNDFRSYDEVEAYLRRYKEHYRTPNIKSYMVGNREQRQWVVQAAHELGLIPTTEGARDMKMDLTHAIDGFHGNEHTLPVTPLYDDVVQLFVRTRTAYTPTLLVLYGGPSAEEWFYTNGADVHDDPKLNRFYPHNWLDELTRRRSVWVREDEHNFREAAAQAAKIQRAGGLVGVGGHGQLQGLGYHWEMWALAMGGMTPREVLRAATIDGARIIGIEQDLGSIEPGKLADLVVLERDPLEDIRNTATIRLVMKNGELYEGDTLRQIWPVERELPPLWWWEDGPVDRRASASASR